MAAVALRNTPSIIRLESQSGSSFVGCRMDAVLVGPTALSLRPSLSERLADQVHRH